MEKHEEDGSIKHIDLGMVGEVTGGKNRRIGDVYSK